jgi:hypothetical protein
MMQIATIIWGILVLVLLWDIYKQLRYVNGNIESLRDKLEGDELEGGGEGE